MAKSPTARTKVPAAIEVPQSRAAAEAAIAEIGRLQRERSRIEAAMNDSLAAVRQQHEAQAQPLGERIRALTAGVQTWCEAHRLELTQGGRVKTAQLASGEVRWRVTPGKVVIRAVENVLAALRERGLARFIRVKEEVNKEAILAEPEAVAGIPGIAVTQAEEFEVVPFEQALAEGAVS